MRGALFLALMVAFVLLAVVLDNGSGGGALAKSRGGSRGGSRGSSSWGSSGKSSSYGRSGGSGKVRSKTKSRLKKAAVVGATAYGAYKLGKLKGKFGKRKGKFSLKIGGGDFDWDDYNTWREKDGFLCRGNNDCNWIDSRFYCQDYEITFTRSPYWFGGNATYRVNIIGSCECPDGMSFDDDEMECQTVLPIGTIVGIVFAVILALLCACGCCWFWCR